MIIFSQSSSVNLAQRQQRRFPVTVSKTQVFICSIFARAAWFERSVPSGLFDSLLCQTNFTIFTRFVYAFYYICTEYSFPESRKQKKTGLASYFGLFCLAASSPLTSRNSLPETTRVRGLMVGAKFPLRKAAGKK